MYLPSLLELSLEQLRGCRPLCGTRGASQFYTPVLAQIILAVSKPAAVETVCRNCRPACKSGYVFLVGLLINNGHAYGTLKVSIRKKTRKGVLFTLHVASLGVSNYVCRRAGLFLKCLILTVCKVDESAEGSALL